MRESFLKLNDRTVVLSGPLTQVTSAIVATLSERGSDVAMIVSDKLREAQRYAENVSEAREIHHNYGRVAAIESGMETQELCSEAISRAAEVFGSIDILIDTHLLGLSPANDEFKKFDQASIHMSQAALPYLEGRQKGRIIILTNDFLVHSSQEETPQQKLVKEISPRLLDKNISANVISCGITEEYLLAKYEGKLSLKDALDKEVNELGSARLVDPMEIASLVTFIASPVSSGVCGQTIHINGGLFLD